MRARSGIFLAILAIGVCSPCRGRADSKNPPVQLVLTAVRPVARVGGAPARVRVELRNNGQDDFIVGEDLLPIVNARTYVLLEIVDPSGHAQQGTVMTAEIPFSVRNASWTRIAPGHYYGIEFDLDTKDYPALSHPGRFKITVKYISKGGNTPASPDWQVPSYKVWEGEITSNTVTITVLPRS